MAHAASRGSAVPTNDASGTAPGVVLDTNAVLDWLVFRDPGMRIWAEAIESRHLHWLACAAMRDELSRTLGYAQLARWQPEPEPVLAAFDRWSTCCVAPTNAHAHGLTCSDPDDQIFLDLGLAQRARWLVTHDRALLRLARTVRRHGLTVVKPAAGQAELTGL